MTMEPAWRDWCPVCVEDGVLRVRYSLVLFIFLLSIVVTEVWRAL